MRIEGERGQTMAEYAVVLAVITIVTVALFLALGTQAGSLIDAVTNRVTD